MPSALTERRRVDALFRALSSDYLLREQFVTDPAQLLTEYVSGERLDPDAAAATNQLIYSIVSNPGLLEWLRSSGRKAAPADADDFALEFAGALAKHGDAQSILAVLRAANENKDLFTVQAAVLGRLIAAFGSERGSIFAGTEQSSPGTEVSPGGGTEVSPGRVFAGTEMSSPGTEMSPGRVFAGTEMSSPGTEMSPGRVFAGTEMSSPGTEMSPGRVFAGTEMSSPGTEMSPGRVFAGTEMSSPGTEMSPGRVFAGTEMSSPGTEISPGGGTEMSPGAVFAGTEMSSPGTEVSPGGGTEMSPGAVFAGTEMSSPGTEISPGGGTEMSPGRLGVTDFRVTLEALVDFAGELRRAGALNALRFR